MAVMAMHHRSIAAATAIRAIFSRHCTGHIARNNADKVFRRWSNSKRGLSFNYRGASASTGLISPKQGRAVY